MFLVADQRYLLFLVQGKWPAEIESKGAIFNPFMIRGQMIKDVEDK